MQLLSPSVGAERTARLLASVLPRLNRAMRGQVRPATGLSMPQFIALRHLRHGQQSAGALAAKFGVSRPTITRMVDGLIKKGLVERHVDPHDRRVAIISLTEAGRELQAATEATAERHLAELLARLPAHRLSQLSEALTDLVALLEPSEAPQPSKNGKRNRE